MPMAEGEMVDREYHGHYYCWMGWLLLAFIGNERLRKEAWRRRPSALCTKPLAALFTSKLSLFFCTRDFVSTEFIRKESEASVCLCLPRIGISTLSAAANKLTESSHRQSLGFSLLCIKRPFSDSLRAPFGIWNEFHTGNLYITA